MIKLRLVAVFAAASLTALMQYSGASCEVRAPTGGVRSRATEGGESSRPAIMPDQFYSGVLYYVSNEGNDDNDGRSPESPWRTIAQVNSRTFRPGDGVLFRSGDTWRETIRMNSSGTADEYIAYGAYGSGVRPRILGSTQAADWAPLASLANVWRSATPVPNPHDYYASEIWFVESDGTVTWGVRQGFGKDGDDNSSLLARLTKEYHTAWIGDSSYNGLGHIYVYSPSNPAGRYQSVEVPVRENIIRLGDQEHVGIDNLILRYGLGRGVYENYKSLRPLTGFIAINCEIGYFGIKNGSNMYGLSLRRADVYIGNNEIHDCGRRGISLHGYKNTPETTIENVVVERNHFHHGFHTTGVDSMNGGGHTIRNLTIRWNVFEGDPDVTVGKGSGAGDPGSNSLWIANSNNAGQISDVDIYGNVFTYAHSSAVKLVDVANVGVYNNTFYGFNSSVRSDAALVWLGNCRNVDVRNNIFVKNTNDDRESVYPRRSCVKADDDMADTLTMANNLYFAFQDDAWIIRRDGGSKQHFRLNQWDEYVKTGVEAHSPVPADPLFQDPEESDFHLQRGSPAVAAGDVVEDVRKDFDGKDYDRKTPSLGAFEFQGD